METEDQGVVGIGTAAGRARIEEQLTSKPSDDSRSQDNRAEKKDFRLKTDVGAIPSHSSSTSSLIESSTAPVVEMESQSASGDTTISSTTSQKGVAPFQVKEFECSSSSLSSSANASSPSKENIEEQQTLNSASSLASDIPGLTMKNEGKDFSCSPSSHDVDFLRKTEELLRDIYIRRKSPIELYDLGLPFLCNEAKETEPVYHDILKQSPHLCKAQNRECSLEEMQMNVSSASSTSADEAKILESLQFLARQKVAYLEGRSQFPTGSSDELDVSNRDASMTAVSETSAVSSCASDREMKITEPEDGRRRSAGDLKGAEIEDDERKAFFYISSSSVPGMGKESEWPSVSGGYQMPAENAKHRVTREDSREPCACLGSRKCHYVVLVVAILTSIIGCVTYHLQERGMGPEILKPIGASTAFISFAVCAFSSVYLSYLSNYPFMPAVPNYELLGDADSVMAMNRAANPQCHYTESGYYISRSQSTPEKGCYRETQSADYLDRRGYGRRSVESLQSEMRRSGDGRGSPGIPRSPRRLNTGWTDDRIKISEKEQLMGLRRDMPPNRD